MKEIIIKMIEVVTQKKNKIKYKYKKCDIFYNLNFILILSQKYFSNQLN